MEEYKTDIHSLFDSIKFLRKPFPEDEVRELIDRKTEAAGFGGGWPFSLAESPDALRESYRAAHFPRTRALLDSSIVLFSQTRPLIAQTSETVDRYVEAFAKVWSRRDALAPSA